MPVTNDHVVGFAAGVAVTALAFYWYDQNRERVDEFLQSQGINVGQPGAPFGSAPQYSPPPSGDGTAGKAPTIEELMAQKERLDDMIAELLANQAQQPE
jgi:hypothetical protein